MKRTFLTLCVATAAFLLFGCGAPATNTSNATNTANSNAKPAAAAPTVAGLLDMEKKAFEAWSKKDGKFFEGFLADNFVGFEGGKRVNKAEEVKMINENKCDIKSFALSDEKMSPVGPDAAVLVSKAVVDGMCEGQKIPSPMTAATLFVRSGEAWKAAYHSQTLVVDPKAPPPPPPAAKKEEPKKEEKPAANSNSNAANTAPAPAKPTASANSEALAKLHQAGWNAFMAKDTKWFNDNISSTFALVDPIGTYFGSKADTIKQWTETMKCEGITTTKTSDAMATSVSPTIEILTLTGSADGTCDGRKNGPIHQAAIYLKEGDAWKVAFMIEAPAM